MTAVQNELKKSASRFTVAGVQKNAEFWDFGANNEPFINNVNPAKRLNFLYARLSKNQHFQKTVLCFKEG